MTMLSALLLSASAWGASGDNVLLEFSATWCGPCQQMSPIVSRLERQGHPIRKVDIDRNPALARKYGITAIPAFVLVIDGKVCDRFEGATSESRLRSLLAKIPRPRESENIASASPSQPPAESPRRTAGPAASKKEGTPSVATKDVATGDVLLDFSASWSGPCQQMRPILARLERQGCSIRKVDIDREPQLVRQYGIKAIPAFVLLVDGKEFDRIEGVTSEGELKNLLARKSQTPEPAVETATAEAEQTAPERKRGFLSSLLGKNKRERQPSRERPQIPPEEPVIRAKHDGLSDAAGATIVDPMAASVRVRVKDDDVVNFGSGTIIDSRPGRTIVLTCGHIFRNLAESSRIEVDVFLRNRYETFVGKVIRYDAEADVGLCAIPTNEVLPVSQVAPAAGHVARNDRVFSIGCGGGEPPTKQHLLVTSLNRYLGPDTVECTGIPIQGRSGGGLFNRSGEVIGVCIYADPRDRRGLYAGLRSIHQLLDEAKLAGLYRREASPREPLDPATELAAGNPHSSSSTEWPDSGNVRPTSFASSSENSRPLKAMADGGLERPDAIRAGSDRVSEAEVVCIIRPLDNPRAKSRVVIINRASPKFVSYLNHEMDDQPHLTMRSVKSPDSSPAGPRRYRRSAESR